MNKPDVKSDKMSKFNFIWVDSTNFLPYTEETLNENSIFARQGACLGNAQQMALNSLARYGHVTQLSSAFYYLHSAKNVTFLTRIRYFIFNPETSEKVKDLHWTGSLWKSSISCDGVSGAQCAKSLYLLEMG